MPIDVLTGFVDPNGDARGRPVGVAMDKSGALLVADDGKHRVARDARPAKNRRELMPVRDLLPSLKPPVNQ